MKTTPDQLSLPLFDTTALTSSMGLYSGLSFGEPTDELDRRDRGRPPRAGRRSCPNFRLTGARRLAPEWKTRAADNIAAIRLMLEIEEEARNAPRKSRNASPSSRPSARATSPTISSADPPRKPSRRAGKPSGRTSSSSSRRPSSRASPASRNMRISPRNSWSGLSGARSAAWASPAVACSSPDAGPASSSPSCPEVLEAKTTLTGVEMDPVTARIAKLLHPNARIRAEDFTKARIAETYDLVIGNPPFSSRTVRADDPAGRLSLSLQDYFIARSIERLRPGGLAAFVTSRWTMDKADPTARMFLASMADLVGAVRLPEGAMRAAAGTDVVVDILFFQKRGPDEPAKPANWIDLAEVMAAQDGEEAISINRHFVEHPHMVLGSHARTSSAYGPTYTCEPFPADRNP